MYAAACQDIMSYPVVAHDMGCDVDIYVISGFQGILDLSHTFGLCSSSWAFAPKHPCQAFVQVEVEVNKILQKDMLAEAPLEQETFYQLFCYAEDDWKIQALRDSEHCVLLRYGSPVRGGELFRVFSNAMLGRQCQQLGRLCISCRLGMDSELLESA